MRADKDKADERASDSGQPAVHDEAARQRPARGHPRAHAADVRHHRARLPDRQDARRHAAAVPRPVRPVLSVPRRARRAPPAPRTTTLSDGYERITRYYVSQLAYLASRLDAMPEGEGTVLDNSLPAVPVEHVVRHASTTTRKLPRAHWPAAWAARSRPAASLDYLDKGDDNRKLCSLYLVAHGPHGREARPLRRRRHAPRPVLSVVAVRGAATRVQPRASARMIAPRTAGTVALGRLPG